MLPHSLIVYLRYLEPRFILRLSLLDVPRVNLKIQWMSLLSCDFANLLLLLQLLIQWCRGRLEPSSSSTRTVKVHVHTNICSLAALDFQKWRRADKRKKKSTGVHWNNYKLFNFFFFGFHWICMCWEYLQVKIVISAWFSQNSSTKSNVRGLSQCHPIVAAIQTHTSIMQRLPLLCGCPIYTYMYPTNSPTTCM